MVAFYTHSSFPPFALDAVTYYKIIKKFLNVEINIIKTSLSFNL